MNEPAQAGIAPQEIIVLHRNEPSSKEPRRSRLDSIEQWCRIIATIALPTIVAVGGWYIQNSLALRTSSQEYVKLAVAILTESKEKATPEMSEWAVDLLNANSPTPFSRTTTEKLANGSIKLPPTNDGASLETLRNILWPQGSFGMKGPWIQPPSRGAEDPSSPKLSPRDEN
ncbi:MAG TPA: hypothetical protein VGZ26_12655 [Pirellulales bacterium]|jgi:hypothetical protein|nr:hypothetical protein [Pirellulales bacterium]